MIIKYTLTRASKIHFVKENLVPLTPDGQVIYVHLVPVVILDSIDKGIPFGFA